MPILLDHQLREQIPHETTEFPLAYYRDELASLPGRAGPAHWHPDFEIATALTGVVEYQVGQQHVALEPGGQHLCQRKHASWGAAAFRRYP